MNKRPRTRAGKKVHRVRYVGNIDFTMLFIVVFLLVFGLVMVYSASSYDAMLKMQDAAYYFRKQLIATGLGIAVMIGIVYVDYHYFKYFGWILYGAAVVSIALVKTSLGITANGASRWLRLGPVSMQPAELAKLAIIVLVATLVSKFGKEGIVQINNVGILGTIAGLVGLEIYGLTKNLSSMIIVMGIAFLMMFVASPDIRLYVVLVVGTVLVAGIFVYAVYSGALSADMSFRLSRIKVWLDPTAYAQSGGFQTLQALYAIGSGGMFGKGLGQSMQKIDYIPEAQNDMIFSIICEELGLFGAFCIILLFLVLIWRCMVIAYNAPDLFGSMLVVGVMIHLALQVVLNVAVVTNTIPNTGITLPFISYGGTSVVFLLIEMGIVLNVSRRIRVE